jgi:hypothetical protein
MCNNSSPGNSFYSFKKLDAYSSKTTCDPKIFGGAWAITRESYEKIGYFLDDCFLNFCDASYVYATIFDKEKWELIPNLMKEERYFLKYFSIWINKAQKILNNKGITVRGSLVHLMHDATIA